MLPADVFRCTQTACPHRHTCRRWTEPAASDRQDYACLEVGPEPCPHYIPVEPGEGRALDGQENP